MELERKINLLFVLIKVNMGGAERIVLDLVQMIDRSKFNIYLAYFEEGILVEDFRRICKETFCITKRSGFDPYAMFRIASIINKYSIDVINAHHYLPFFYSYLGSRVLHNRKLIYTEHSVPEVMTILTSKHNKIFRYMLRNIDRVIGISKEIGETFKNAYPKYSEKIQIIVNGVDVDRFTTNFNREDLRLKWGILPEHFVIGTVANFRKVKNHACLIRAVHQLSVSYPQLRVLLVGQGFAGDSENSECDVIELINLYGLQQKVIMTGYQKDIPNVLKTFDVFCLPSFSEGLPVSVLEAMAARVPVVASNVRGIKEVVSLNKTGVLFPSDNDNELAKSIEGLMRDVSVRESISIHAYDYVRKEHGLKQWVKAYERLFGPNNFTRYDIENKNTNLA